MIRIPAHFPVEIIEKHGHYHFRGAADLSMQAVFHLDGRLDVERINRALRLLVDRFPVLGCRMEVGIWRLRWVRRTDLDTVRWCDVVETADVDGEVLRFNRLPCAPWEGHPLAQARVVRGPAGDALCLKSNHAASDAVGFQAIIAELCTILAGVTADPGFTVEPLVLERSMRPVLRGLSWVQRAQILWQTWKDKRETDGPPTPFGLPFVGGGLAERVFLTHEFSGARLARMKAYARAQGASFNDLMNALFASAIYERLSEGKARPLLFFNAIDLRRYSRHLRRVEGPRNLSNLVPFKLVPAVGASFEWLVREFSRHVKRLRKQSFLGIGGFFYLQLREWIPNSYLTRQRDQKLRKYEKYARDGGFIPAPVMLSSIGEWDEHAIQFPGVRVQRAVMLPPVFANWCFFVYGVFRGEVTVSVGTCQPAKMVPLLRDLFGLMDRRADTL